MAITAQGARLTQAHRQTQAQIRTVVLRQILSIWPMLDPVRLDETSPAFLAAATRLVVGGRALSSRASMLYLQQFRAAENIGGVAPIMVERPDSALLASVRTSLTVTGPVSIKQNTARGLLTSTAAKTALANVSAAAVRHVLDGGREVVLNSVRDDPETIGWARVTSAKPCAFCAMLAGRGGVYLKEGTADFDAHDGCGCVAEPAFQGQGYKLPPGNEDFRDLWSDVIRGDLASEYYEQNPEYLEKLRNARSAKERTSLQVNGPWRWYINQQRAS